MEIFIFFALAAVIWLLYVRLIKPAWEEEPLKKCKYTKKNSSYIKDEDEWDIDYTKDEEQDIEEPINPVMPYRIRKDFFTANEYRFFYKLAMYVGDLAFIFPKVGLKDIFEVETGIGANWGTYFNKIARKHVDFILVEPNDMKVVCAIELDDSSHNGMKAKINDKFKNRLFEEQNLPLIRFSTRETISDEKFDGRIGRYIGKTPVIENAPFCVKCGARMMRLASRKGESKGKYYWGCSNYPKCRNIINI